jgi:hypothetical protein
MKFKLAVSILALAAVVLIFMILRAPDAGMEAAFQRVPLGSSVVDLETYFLESMGKTHRDDVKVYEWAPMVGSGANRVINKTEFGTFVVTRCFGKWTPDPIGKYVDWVERYRNPGFSGRIGLIDEPSELLWALTLAEIKVYEFIYIDGVLRKKTWGYMPG